MTAPWQPLLDDADGLPEGPAKLAVLEEAVRLADSHGDEQAGFDLRVDHLMSCAVASGRAERLLVAFAWCLARCDREPERFESNRALEWGVWVMLAIRLTSVIPRPRVEAVCDDLLERFRRGGWPLTWFYRQRAMVAVALGDPDAAADYWRQALAHPVGTDPDDAMCARLTDLAWGLVTQNDAAALAAAEPLFTRLTRADETHHAFLAPMLVPLVRAGRLNDAAAVHRHGYPVLEPRIGYLAEIGKHAEFLALTGNLAAAVRVVERRLGWVYRTTFELDVFHFNAASRFVVERLAARGHSARLRLPKECPAWREDGRYDPAVLAAHFDAEASRVLARFDARNGNDYTSRRAARSAELVRGLVTDFPLRSRVPGRLE